MRVSKVLVVFGCLHASIGSAYAQATAPGSPTATDDALTEIVVTAERQVSTVQRTAAAIEVIGNDVLQKQRVVELTDLNSVLTDTQIVPVLAATQLYIRGIGSEFVDPRADPAVALSVNGLFYNRPLPLGFSFLDVSRVEVLQGPQGTLYGRTAAAGAVNIVSNQPTNEFGGMVEATGGNLGDNELTAVLNLPFNDKFAVRLAYDRDRRDGYIGDYYDDVHSDAARIIARWTPVDELTVTAESDYMKIGGHGGGTQYYPCPGAAPYSLYLPPRCAAIPPGGVVPKTGSDGSFVSSDRLQMDYDLGAATLTSITGFVGTHERYYDQPDGTYFNGTILIDNNDWSEELRLASHDSAAHRGGLAWQTGVYLFDSSGDFYDLQQGPTEFPPTNSTSYTALPQRSEALYAQATYGLTDQFRVTAGGRFTHDYKSVTSSTANFLGTVDLGEVSASFDKWTYKAGLEYDLAPANLLYANVSTGYVSGGANGGSTEAPLLPAHAPATFQPETITAYEVGSKNRFFDNRLQVNGDVYYYDFKNYQYNYPSYVQGVSAETLNVQNAGSATAYGSELSLVFALTSDDRFSGSVEWSHARFAAISLAGYLPPTSAFEITVPSGSPLVHDPEWSGLLGYEHSWRIDQTRSLSFSVNSKISSKYLVSIGSTDPADTQKGYTMTDASLAYRWHSEKYGLRFWVKNIENSVVNTYAEGTGFHLYGVEPPRTYGVTATANF